MTPTKSGAGRRDSNLKEAVNIVNIVNFLGAAENVLSAGAEFTKQIPTPLSKFTKYISSPGFLRFESGKNHPKRRGKTGGAGGMTGACSLYSLLEREYVEVLLTYRARVVILLWAERKAWQGEWVGRELRVNFQNGSSRVSRGLSFFKVEGRRS